MNVLKNFFDFSITFEITHCNFEGYYRKCRIYSLHLFFNKPSWKVMNIFKKINVIQKKNNVEQILEKKKLKPSELYLPNYHSNSNEIASKTNYIILYWNPRIFRAMQRNKYFSANRRVTIWRTANFRFFFFYTYHTIKGNIHASQEPF